MDSPSVSVPCAIREHSLLCAKCFLSAQIEEHEASLHEVYGTDQVRRLEGAPREGRRRGQEALVTPFRGSMTSSPPSRLILRSTSSSSFQSSVLASLDALTRHVAFESRLTDLPVLRGTRLSVSASRREPIWPIAFLSAILKFASRRRTVFFSSAICSQGFLRGMKRTDR